MIAEDKNRLGIVGGGQLGKMLAIAASNLGIDVSFLDPSQEAVARNVAKHLCAPFDDRLSIQQLFERCKAVTFEFENVSVDALKKFGIESKLAPNPQALFVANDRIREKQFFQDLGLEVAPYVGLVDCEKLSDLEFTNKIGEAAKSLGFPVIVKTCSLGYDGKGQVSLQDIGQISEVLQLKSSNRVVVEKRIPFSREVSIIAARSRKGEVVVYPTPENVHKQGILFTSIVLESEPIFELKQAISKVLNKLEYVGVLAIEFFEVAGKYLANEMAPRVHNTGHWTIEGAVTSQFENHVRAVMDLPLGDPSLRFPTAMLNLIGDVPNIDKILSVKGAHLHLYGKLPRLGRKLGHVTIEANTSSELQSRLDSLIALL